MFFKYVLAKQKTWIIEWIILFLPAVVLRLCQVVFVTSLSSLLIKVCHALKHAPIVRPAAVECPEFLLSDLLLVIWAVAPSPPRLMRQETFFSCLKLQPLISYLSLSTMFLDYRWRSPHLSKGWCGWAVWVGFNLVSAYTHTHSHTPTNPLNFWVDWLLLLLVLLYFMTHPIHIWRSSLPAFTVFRFPPINWDHVLVYKNNITDQAVAAKEQALSTNQSRLTQMNDYRFPLLEFNFGETYCMILSQRCQQVSLLHNGSSLPAEIEWKRRKAGQHPTVSAIELFWIIGCLCTHTQWYVAGSRPTELSGPPASTRWYGE